MKRKKKAEHRVPAFPMATTRGREIESVIRSISTKIKYIYIPEAAKGQRRKNAFGGWRGRKCKAY